MDHDQVDDVIASLERENHALRAQLARCRCATLATQRGDACYFDLHLARLAQQGRGVENFSAREA
jgi:hypothetical protein